MIGLTLVTVVAVLGAGLNSATRSAITDQVDADYVVDGKDDLPFRAAGGDKLAAVPGVKAATQVRSETALVKGKETRDHRARPRHDRALLLASTGRRAPTGRSGSSERTARS